MAWCCREKRHVHCGPSNRTLPDPRVTAWCHHSVVWCALMKQRTLVRVCWHIVFHTFSLFFRFLHFSHTFAFSVMSRLQKARRITTPRAGVSGRLIRVNWSHCIIQTQPDSTGVTGVTGLNWGYWSQMSHRKSQADKTDSNGVTRSLDATRVTGSTRIKGPKSCALRVSSLFFSQKKTEAVCRRAPARS